MKFKKFCFVSLLLIVALCMGACSMLQGILEPVKADPVPIEGSVLSKYIPDLKSADFILCLANLQAIEKGAYSRDDAERFFDDLEDFIDQPITYSDLAVKAIKDVSGLRERYGKTFILVSSYTDLLEGEIVPITPIDRALIRQHIQNQRIKVLALF